MLVKAGVSFYFFRWKSDGHSSFFFPSQKTDNSSVCVSEALWRTPLRVCLPSAAVTPHTAFLPSPFLLTEHYSTEQHHGYFILAFLPSSLAAGKVQDGCAGAAVTSDDVAVRTDFKRDLTSKKKRKEINEESELSKACMTSPARFLS